MVFEADARHAASEGSVIRSGEERGLARIGDRARADAAGIGDGARLVELGRFAVEPGEHERLPHFADRIDIAPLPGQLPGGAGVITGDAAQHALAGHVGRDEYAPDHSLADVIEVVGVVERLQARRLEGGVCLVDVGDVGVDRQLPAETIGAVGGNVEDAIVVEHRRDGGRQSAVVVTRRRALETIGAEVEKALVRLAA